MPKITTNHVITYSNFAQNIYIYDLLQTRTKLEPHYHGQVSFNFFPALDKQLLNYTVSLLAANQIIYSNSLDKQNKFNAET